MKKVLKLSLLNIWRNKVLSLATIFVIAIIIFIFNILLSVNFIANNALQSLSEKIDIVVYLKESASQEEIDKVKKEIEKLEGIKEVTFTSKDNALQTLRSTHPDLTLAFERYNLGNPLPQSLNISTIHPKYHATVSEIIQQDQFAHVVSRQTEDDDKNIINSVSENLMALTNFARQILFWVIITFLIGGVLIMINALHLTIFSRKKEIEVMKIIGASRSLIRWPFIIESIIYGVLAVLFSFGMLFILAQNIDYQAYLTINIYLLFLAELGFTLVLGIISSILAVHEHI